MPRRSPSRAVYAGLNVQKLPRRGRRRAWLLLLLLPLALLVWVGVYLNALGRSTALSDARDMVALAIGETVERVLREEEWSYEDFVTIRTDATGAIAAVTTNTRRVNLFTARVLREITEVAERGELELRVYLGDLLGANLLLGQGPLLRIQVGLMTSPDLRLRSEFSAVGINQTRHALTLSAAVDIDLFIPLGSVSSRVETELPVAETVILGRVPDTYVNTEVPHGQS